MSSAIHNILSESALKILRPLVRVMIRNGVSSRSVEELVRKAYVDEAFEAGRVSGSKTTISSVSAQTGLSRKEVKRLHELDDVQRSDLEQKYNRGTRVISGWTNDTEFTDADGEAAELSLEEGQGSFPALVKNYSGDIPTRAMLDLLVAADCVAVRDGHVRLVKKAYVPGNDSTEIIRILGTDANELLNTVDYNLTAPEADRRYQRKVSTTMIDKNAIAEFRSMSAMKSQALLEELDAWLSQHEVSPDDDDARYVSLGIYFYEH